MADGVIVETGFSQFRDGAGGARRSGAVQVHLNRALGGIEGDGDGALGGNILAVGLLGAMAILAIVLVVALDGGWQGFRALAAQGLCLGGFLRGLCFRGIFRLDVALRAIAGGQEVDSSGDAKDDDERGCGDTKRTSLLLAVTGL